MSIRAAELRVIIGADTSGVEQGLSSTSNWLRRLAGDNQTFRGAFAGVFAGSLMTQAIGNMQSLGGEAIQAYAGYERMGLSLQSLTAKELLSTGAATSMAEAMQMGSSRAKELQGWVQKLAIESPFTQQGVADAFQTALTYSFTAKEAQRLTQAMLDMAAGSGQSQEKLGLISLALGQINQSGKLAGQEVNQLAQAGVGVDAILAKAFGKTTAEIKEMREKGLIPADEAIDAILSSFEDLYGGASKLQGTTFTGLLASLTDLKEMGLREFFGETFRMAQPELQKFVDTLQKVETMDKIREAGKEFANFLRDAVGAAKDAIQWFEGLNETNQKLLLGFGALVLLRGPVFGLLADGASLAGGMMKTVGGLSEAWRAWNAGMTLTTSLQAGLGAMPVTLGSIALGVGSIVAVWATWNQQIVETNRRGLEQTGSAWDDFFRQQVAGGNTLKETTKDFSVTYQNMMNSIRGSGPAGWFVDKVGLAKQAMGDFEQVARTGAGTYKEYVEATIDAGIATGLLHEGYRKNADSWESSGNAMQYLADQLGVVTEREYFLANFHEEKNARDEENHFRKLTWTEEEIAANQLLLEQQLLQEEQRKIAQAEYQAQVETAKGALASYREAVAQVAESESQWLSQTGNQLVEYMSKEIPEGSALWREGIAGIDEVMGTSALQAYETQEAYQALVAEFEESKDKGAFVEGLIALRDEGLETVRSKMQETIDKAQELYNQLMGLPKTLRIDIEFYGELPSWLNGIPTPTTRNPRNQRDAIGGVGYPGEEIWVGERGPELFRPFSAGVIEPAHKSQTGSGSPTFNFYPKEVLDLEETAWKIFNYLQGQMA